MFYHADARPPHSEVSSVDKAIRIAEKTSFSGHLHIGHTSVADSLYFVDAAKSKGRRISAGVTPHHVIYDMAMLSKENGIFYKMNPPLRPEDISIELFECERDLQPREVSLRYEYLEKLAEECEQYYGFDRWKKFRLENHEILEKAFS